VKSRAALLNEFGAKFEIGYIDIPEPQDEEVVIRVLGAGVCGSDIEIWSGNIVRPGFRFPFVLGHENVGEVVALGPKVRGFKEGDKVIVYSVWSDLSCKFCLSGYYNLCSNMAVPGQSYYFGGFSEYMLISSFRWLHLLPNDANPAEYAPLADAGTTAYSAVVKALSAIGYDSRGAIVIYGFGGLGLYALQIIKSLAPYVEVITVDKDANKLEFSLNLGAKKAVMPEELSAVVGELIPSDSRVAVIDLVGSQQSLANIMDSIRNFDTTIVLVGLYGQEASFKIFDLVGFQKKIVGSNYGTFRDLMEVCTLLERRMIKSYVNMRSLPEINQILDDIKEGKQIGRNVIVPNR